MFNSNTNETPVALGFTAREWVDMLNTKQAAKAQKSLAYYDGQQEEYLIKTLNEQRSDWQKKKINPRWRNLTKMVVEKSGMLFKDSMPCLEVFDANMVVENPAATELLYEMFAREEFSEFWTNFDQVLRLLKTALVLIQWDAEEMKFVPGILHRGNCEVVLSPINRKVIGLIHSVASNMWRVWTPEEVIDLMADDNGQAYTVGSQPNTYGVIPVTPFYDTNTPRQGFWVEQDESLVNINELYNLHLTDSEFSVLWSKLSTLFTNGRPAGNNSNSIEVAEVVNSPLPRMVPNSALSPGVNAGPGQAVVLQTEGGDPLFVEYRNPNIDLKPLDEVVDNWVRNFAGDWSVRLEMLGQARAASGFQFIVEEMPNLELRKQRQRMFENGFKRLYRVLREVHNVSTGVKAFPADSQLFVRFEAPVLPVDLAVQETVWSQRIKEGRATEIDYFVATLGISEEEAQQKFIDIVEFNKRKAALLGLDANGVEAVDQNIEQGKKIEMDGAPDTDPNDK
jgi:hypothetical protein